MSLRMRDWLGSALMLAFIAALWVQRDYSNPLGGLFPDTIMVIMAVFIAMTLLLSLRRTPAARATSSAEESTAAGETAGKLRRVLTVVVLLILWVWFYRPAGFAVTGVLGFASIAWYLGDRAQPLRSGLWALGVGALATFVIYLVFDYFLLVPLPPGILFE